MQTKKVLSDGVTGNTSDFGSEESWFDPRSDNKESSFRCFLKELFYFTHGLTFLAQNRMIRNRTCGICLQNDKILLIKHSPAVKSPIFWSPPGGRVNLFETLEGALKREFLEETGLQIAVKKLLFVNEFISQPIHALEYFFEVEILSGTLVKGTDPELTPHQQIIADVQFLSFEEINKLPKNYVHNLFWEIQKLDDILKMQGLYQWKA